MPGWQIFWSWWNPRVSDPASYSSSSYVALIPKASGGSRPLDQRPIAVLYVLYRLWAKGITLSWAPTLHGSFLGPSVLGFRAQAGTRHVAQLLSDLVVLQQGRKRPLFLVSFDLEKCFASLPWWAVFGALDHAGPPQIVRCFRTFYGYSASDSASGTWTERSGKHRTALPGCPARHVFLYRIRKKTTQYNY